MSKQLFLFYGRKEGNVLFNDALNTFYLWLYHIRHLVKTILIARVKTCCHHMGYSFRLAAGVLLYAPWPLIHQSWKFGWNEK